MDTELLQYLFQAMLKGNAFRLSESGKSFWGRHSDKWWTIQSINCIGEITICGNNHTILSDASVDHIIHKVHTKLPKQ